MQYGISLRVDADFDSDLWGLPPPSKQRWITKSDSTKSLNILYHFQYSPQSWREWQRVASMKVQISNRIARVEFEEYQAPESIDSVYSISELGKHFTEFVKYHKPLYPKDKSEFMRSLTIYAKRLHYEKMLHFEAVLAMALHFNSKCEIGYSFRELNRKTRAIFELDREEWKIKLSDEARHKVLSESALKSAQVKNDKSQAKRDRAKSLRDDGMTLDAISSELGVSLSTVKRWLRV